MQINQGQPETDRIIKMNDPKLITSVRVRLNNTLIE